jgi:divalent metal cation (Fe/Co/Zn/Cd) transporter
MTISLNRRALVLSYFTLGYNILEGAMSILAGYWAGSVALVGFGLDSFVESLSGSIMIWRFRQPAGSGEAEERRERAATRAVGYTFLVLGAYVLYESLEKLFFQEAPSPSLLGMVIAGVSLLVMPGLFLLKQRTGQSLGSNSLQADARQTLACAFLSGALLLGLGLNYLFGLWQADPVIGLIIVVLLIREGYETLKKGKLCSCCGGLPGSSPTS